MSIPRRRAGSTMSDTPWHGAGRAVPRARDGRPLICWRCGGGEGHPAASDPRPWHEETEDGARKLLRHVTLHGDRVRLGVVQLGETERAIKVRVVGQRYWLPRSQLSHVSVIDSRGTIEIPVWLAHDKGITEDTAKRLNLATQSVDPAQPLPICSLAGLDERPALSPANRAGLLEGSPRDSLPRIEGDSTKRPHAPACHLLAM